MEFPRVYAIMEGRDEIRLVGIVLEGVGVLGYAEISIRRGPNTSRIIEPWADAVGG